jgi:hypothetical protein
MMRLQKMIQDPPATLQGHIVDNHIILDITAEYQHYWSPQLNFRVEEDETHPEQSIVSGLIGPKPTVWTLFIFIYFIIGVGGLFASTVGVSKWLLGEYSIWLLTIPLTLVLMLSARAVGKYGERLATDQTEWMKQFVRSAIA